MLFSCSIEETRVTQPVRCPALGSSFTESRTVHPFHHSALPDDAADPLPCQSCQAPPERHQVSIEKPAVLDLMGHEDPASLNDRSGQHEVVEHVEVLERQPVAPTVLASRIPRHLTFVVLVTDALEVGCGPAAVGRHLRAASTAPRSRRRARHSAC